MSTTTGIPMSGATTAPRSAARPVASRGIVATLAVIVLVCLLAATVVLLAANTPAPRDRLAGALRRLDLADGAPRGPVATL